MKNKKILFIIAIILVFSAFSTTYYFSIHSKNKVEEKQSLVAIQNSIEKEFKSVGYTIENPNIILNPYKISPLTALIIFETIEEVAPTVTIEGKDELSTYTHTFEKNKIHYLPIYGLYADTENTIIIKFDDIEKEIKIKTDKLPDNFILPTSVTADKKNLTNDLYFYTPSSLGYTCAYDINGDVRWYLNEYMIWAMKRLENGHLMLSTERIVNPPYYMTGLYEIDLLGKIYFEYSLQGGYHHDYFELENGNILVASDNFLNEDGTVEDYIVEIERKTGNIVKQFDLRDILNMKDGANENWIEYDWFHNNSVWYDKKTNSITLSGRHKDAIINIDYETGKLNWIIGDSTNWKEEYQKYFFTPIGEEFEWQWSQHAAMITPEGNVFVFDNGNNKSKIKENYVPAAKSYSRGVMYEINTNTMTIKQIWSYGKQRGSDYYSPYISDVDYLDKDHYIVHSGGIGYKDGEIVNQPAGIIGADRLNSITTEIVNDKVIFELELPTNTFQVEKMSLYANDTYQLKAAEQLGTLGKTEYTNNAISIILNAKKIDEEYEKHNISIVKEYDRLAINGTFERGTNVEIVLYQNLVATTYNWRISKTPYTALCVDIFREEQTDNNLTINKYINKEGLKGQYMIFIKIDDSLYKTDQFVEF